MHSRSVSEVTGKLLECIIHAKFSKNYNVGFGIFFSVLFPDFTTIFFSAPFPDFTTMLEIGVNLTTWD